MFDDWFTTLDEEIAAHKERQQELIEQRQRFWQHIAQCNEKRLCNEIQEELSELEVKLGNLSLAMIEESATFESGVDYEDGIVSFAFS